MTSIVPSAVRIDVVKPIAITTAIATSPRIMLFFFSLYRFYDLDLLRFAFLLPTAICLGNNPNNSAYTSISVLFVRDCPPKPTLRILRIHHMPIPMRFFTFFATIGFRCGFQKSSVEMSNNAHSLHIVVRSGSACECSHFDTACALTLSCFPNCACVRFASFLN